MFHTVCSLHVDWGATGTMLQGIGTFAGVAAVIIGAKIGASAWKEQKRLEHRLETAKAIMTAAYNGKRALAQVRSALMYPQEQVTAQTMLMEDEEAWGWLTEVQRKRHITAQAYNNRLNQTKEQQAALEECLPMSKALFGEELENAVAKIRHQFHTVFVAAQTHIDYEESTDPSSLGREIRSALYDMPAREGERNKISEAITESIAIIERICTPALQLEAERKAKSLFQR